MRDFGTILAKFWTYISGEEPPRRFEERKAIEQNSPVEQLRSPRVPIPPGDVEAELKRILSSTTFRNAPRHSEFLRFVVGKSLTGEAETVKEYLIGLEVFHRRPDYDPATDPIVRAEARRLRARLAEYYGTLGELDQVRIALPKGTYVPLFYRKGVEPLLQEKAAHDEAEHRPGDDKAQQRPGQTRGRGIEPQTGLLASCFISYSAKDQEFADRLCVDLQSKGVRCWFAPEEMKAGRKIDEQIDEAIRLHDRLLLILSEHSMKSKWVNTEIAKARKREVKDGKRVLFPVRLVGFEALNDWERIDSTGQDMAEEIREYFIPDFSNWKDHDSYQTALRRLVRDLKAESAAG